MKHVGITNTSDDRSLEGNNPLLFELITATNDSILGTDVNLMIQRWNRIHFLLSYKIASPRHVLFPPSLGRLKLRRHHHHFMTTSRRIIKITWSVTFRRIFLYSGFMENNKNRKNISIFVKPKSLMKRGCF